MQSGWTGASDLRHVWVLPGDSHIFMRFFHHQLFIETSNLAIFFLTATLSPKLEILAWLSFFLITLHISAPELPEQRMMCRWIIFLLNGSMLWYLYSLLHKQPTILVKMTQEKWLLVASIIWKWIGKFNEKIADCNRSSHQHCQNVGKVSLVNNFIRG